MATDTATTQQQPGSAFAQAAQSVYSWSRSLLSFVTSNGQQVPRDIVKSAANTIVANSQFAIQNATLKLQQGAIDLTEWTATMRQAIVNQEVAAEALARGGWNQVRPSDYANAAQRAEKQFEYLRGFQERIVSGYYGPTLEANGILAHASQYANAPRSSYENVLMQVKLESGHDEAKREKGALDNCPDCIEWAALGWIPIEVMQSQYPISASVCHHNCHCVLLTRNSKSGGNR